MENIERQQYDKPGLWTSDYWQNRELDRNRAQFVLDRLKSEVATVLDIGCGNGLLSRQNRSGSALISVDRSFVALTHGHGPRSQADASNLPLASLSFDAVVCMEMIEHLPFQVLPAVLDEITRIARQQIIITVPYKENLVYSQVICPKCACIFHPYHHVRSFEFSQLQNLFTPKTGVVFQEAYGICTTNVPAFPWAWDLVRRYNQRRAASFPWYATCPQCGFSPPAPDPTSDHMGPARGRGRDLWPKRSTYTWWLAIYTRE